MTREPWGQWIAIVAALTAGIGAAVATRPPAAAPPPEPKRQVVSCCGDPVPPSPAKPGGKPVLRISADPNNLPFTNDKLEGFENKIADIVAAEIGADIEYTWRAQRRGFFRAAFKDGEADVVLGVPAGFDMALTTAPYYRSTYVFVTPHGKGVKSLDDPALKRLKIGVQMIGDDGTNTPPAHALAARGLIDNVVGFTVYGDYREANPPARVVAAVATGEVDAAIAWGPMAGYFAKRQTPPLDVAPVEPAVDPSGLPFTFAIAIGVRRGETKLRDAIDAALAKRKADIEKILDEYAVPRVAKPQGKR